MFRYSAFLFLIFNFALTAAIADELIPPKDNQKVNPTYWEECGISMLPLEDACAQKASDYYSLAKLTKLWCEIPWPNRLEYANCAELQHRLNSLENPFETEPCSTQLAACNFKINYVDRPQSIPEAFHVLILAGATSLVGTIDEYENKPSSLCPLDDSQISDILNACLESIEPGVDGRISNISLSSCLGKAINATVATLNVDNFPNIELMNGEFVCRHYTSCMAKVLDLAGIPNEQNFTGEQDLCQSHTWNTICHSGRCEQHIDCLNKIDYLDDAYGNCTNLNDNLPLP